MEEAIKSFSILDGDKTIILGDMYELGDDSLNEHKKILESALITAQELHGRLVASLRNNEISVAETLISAIKLNKETETVFFNNSLLRLRSNYLEIVENVGKLP